MKNVSVWIAILMMSYIGISQDLTPKKTQFGNTAYYCFSIAQSKTIAKRLEESVYNDTIVHHLEALTHVLEQDKLTCTGIVEQQHKQIQHYRNIIDNHEQVQGVLEKQSKQKIRKHKTQNVVLWVALIGLSTLTFIK